MAEKKLYDVVKGAKDMRQLRCPRCKSVAIHVPDGKGGSVLECPGCHTRFRSTTI